MKVKIFRFLSALVKIRQIHHVIFETMSQFFFSVMKDNSSDTSVSWKITPLYILGQTLYILCTKGTNQSANYLDFWVLRSKFTKLLRFFNNKLAFLQILHHGFVQIIQSFTKKSIKDLSLMTLKSDAKFRKNWLVVSNMT